ncbi:hypothetical protein C2G38_2235861 [Gigaspora rosea]|uniref:Uncharacterized protein n=1 Tax=Gigaspora rosea TaxID=44941 RepID=A0A397TTN2_9GLOM|nr:hypothetical protein C2G38_2235861 [Gigaspora rosea]
MIEVLSSFKINLNPNIINIAAIDNIDLKDATFQYSNIFDVVYNTIHAIAQMVFQYQYFELVNLDNNIRNYPPFGQTFDSDHIVKAIKANIDSTLFVNPLSKDKHHTNKAICSAIITAFSDYGLFELATQFGVKFFDKLSNISST